MTSILLVGDDLHQTWELGFQLTGCRHRQRGAGGRRTGTGPGSGYRTDGYRVVRRNGWDRCGAKNP